MKYLLVKYDDNWADEIDLKGFKVLAEEEWEKLKSYIPNKKFTRYVGSNEDIEYLSKDDFLSRFSVQEITWEECQVFKKFFPYGDGKFPDFDWDVEDDEDEDV